MLVEADSLTKQYGSFTALREFSCGVKRGEVLGLLGPNGAGKTTLLRLLLGYLRPTSGRAAIEGLDCQRQSLAVRRRVSYLPGDARLFPGMRALAVLRFFAQIRPGGNFERAKELAERLDLNVNRRVGSMSTGMRQKLALAATLAADVPLLVLDEPTSNLDPTIRGVVGKLVAEVGAAGRTVLFSSHVLSEVEDVCDRVILLRQGELVHTQVMSQLRTRHRVFLEVHGETPQLPEDLRGQATVMPGPPGQLTIETPGELSPLIAWLATLPLAEVKIEPVGLRAIYEQYHAG